MPSLKTSIRSMGGIYKRYAAPLEKLGIVNLEDFLYHIPFRYDDFSLISKIDQIQPGETLTVRGEVVEIKNNYLRGHFTIQKAKIKDETGTIEVVWFNQPYIAKNILAGNFISISGKAELKAGKIQITNPDFEIATDNFIHTGRLVPIYSQTQGVSSKWMRRQVYGLINQDLDELSDFLPVEIVERNELQNLSDAIKKIHFPDSLEETEKAIKRLSFDELFLTQTSSNLRRLEWQKTLKGHSFNVKANRKKIDDFIKSLPFELTNAQKRSVEEIFADLSADKPMNRLLEGDVGSGKTIVAAISIYLGYLNGFQSVFMAPTEILAGQHFDTISNLLSPLGIKVSLRTRSNKKDEEFDVLIGTHAVLSEKIKFENLGIIIVDEQQRFGVEQRGIMRKKGKNPHFLTMTATPIPRTIALTLYGDLDLSILDEMPKGRREIKTWLVPNEKREGAYEWIKKQVDSVGSQVFIVCPFIEESETMTTIKAATKEFNDLKKNTFKNYSMALLHGKLKGKDKERVLNEFKNKKIDILVATPVVEVGIDIPNADIIIIEAAERFGLSQLHQLRGRVGRNDRQAYCLLFTESMNPNTKQRLMAMEKTNIGSELAELDLKMRGPGEIYGTKQSGRNFLKIASFSDFDLIKKAKDESEKIIGKLDKFPKLKEKLDEMATKEISPD